MKPHSRFNAARRALLFWCLFIGIGAVAGDARCTGRQRAGNGGLASLFSGASAGGISVPGFRFSRHCAFMCKRNSQPDCGSAAFQAQKGGDYLGRDFRPDADGVDHNTIRHLPCKFHVHNLFHFWLFAGRCRACRMDFLQAGAISCTNGFPSARRNGSQPAGCLLLPHGLHEKGRRTGADVYEVRSTERTEGTLGFWWCGRFGMHRWDMPIAPLCIDLSSYRHVTVCSPIWVFHLSAPMRSFCRAAAGKIREADYILVHYQRCGYKNAAQEMDALLGLCGTRVESICCRQGTPLRQTTFYTAQETEPKAC